MDDELLKLFSDEKISQNGHFKMESGYHGSLGLNLDLLFLKPNLIKPFATELGKKFETHNIEAICGPLVGGAILAEMIASKLNIEFYTSERFKKPEENSELFPYTYRIPKTLQKEAKGKKFAIVDDVISAGSAVIGTFQDLIDCEAKAVTIGALLITGSNALDYFKDKNVPLEKIAYLDRTLWIPSECPMCISNIPFT